MRDTKRRLTVTVDGSLLRAANEAVRSGRATSVSAWVNIALEEHAAKERRLRAMADAVAAYEKEHARVLASIEVKPLDEALGRAAGALLAKTRGRDVIDAAVVAVARPRDVILTSDPDDLEPLARATGTELDILPV